MPTKRVSEIVASMRCNSQIDGEVVPSLVDGSTGETYLGREVVVFRRPPGLFGTCKDRKENKRRLTLCRGIVNQCALMNPPTPYWAVLDAMSELKDGFTKLQVVERAVVVVGEAKRAACGFAWDVLRNHHRHARKRNEGMSHMIDVLPDGRLAIRARCADETLQYFAAEAERRERSAECMASLKTSGRSGGSEVK